MWVVRNLRRHPLETALSAVTEQLRAGRATPHSRPLALGPGGALTAVPRCWCPLWLARSCASVRLTLGAASAFRNKLLCSWLPPLAVARDALPSGEEPPWGPAQGPTRAAASPRGGPGQRCRLGPGGQLGALSGSRQAARCSCSHVLAVETLPTPLNLRHLPPAALLERKTFTCFYLKT